MLNNFKKSKGWVGMEITATHIRMIQLGGSSEKPIVKHYIVNVLPEGIYDGNEVQSQEKLGAVIEKTFKAGGFSTKNIAVGLPAHLVITNTFEMSSELTGDDQMEAVLQEVQNTVPLDIEEVYVDYKVLGPGITQNSIKVAYAVSKKQHVDEFVGAIEIGGLNVKIVDSDHNALLHSVCAITKNQLNNMTDENIMLVQVGATKTEYMVFRSEQTIWSREHHVCARNLTDSIQSFYGIDVEESKKIAHAPLQYINKYPTIDSDCVQPFMDSLAIEIKRHIEMFNEGGTNLGIRHILLSGEITNMQGTIETVEARTSITTEVANPLAHFSLTPNIDPEILIDEAASLLVATGMAVRIFE